MKAEGVQPISTLGSIQFFRQILLLSARANFSTGRAAIDNRPIELQLRGIPANQGLHSGDSQGCTTAVAAVGFATKRNQDLSSNKTQFTIQ